MINLNNPVLVKLPANLLGKDYVVGDLHGCFDELELLLNYVSFDKERDRLFCVGDLIHRGPKSLECLNLLKSRNSKNEKWFFSTLGNHDEVYNDKNAIKYESEDDHINLDKYEKYLKELPYIYCVEHLVFPNFYIIHSELNYDIIYPHIPDNSNPNLKIKYLNEFISSNLSVDIVSKLNSKNFNLSDNQRKRLIWSREVFKFYFNTHKEEIINGDFSFLNDNNVDLNQLKIFCGHNIVPFPMQIGHQIYCDTGACFGYYDEERIINFSEWGKSFFSLSLVDINMGNIYTCVSSEKSIKINQDDIEYKRGDILLMDRKLYKSILD